MWGRSGFNARICHFLLASSISFRTQWWINNALSFYRAFQPRILKRFACIKCRSCAACPVMSLVRTRWSRGTWGTSSRMFGRYRRQNPEPWFLLPASNDGPECLDGGKLRLKEARQGSGWMRWMQRWCRFVVHPSSDTKGLAHIRGVPLQFLNPSWGSGL